eukprot:gene5776-4127_t
MLRIFPYLHEKGCISKCDAVAPLPSPKWRHRSIIFILVLAAIAIWFVMLLTSVSPDVGKDWQSKAVGVRERQPVQREDPFSLAARDKDDQKEEAEEEGEGARESTEPIDASSSSSAADPSLASDTPTAKSRYRKDSPPPDEVALTTTTSVAPVSTERPTKAGETDAPEEQEADLPLVLRYPDLIKEDVLHTPFANVLGYQSIAGLQLNAFTTSGVQIHQRERKFWEDHQRHLNILNETRQKAREVLPKLLRGDSLHNPLDMLLFTDRYFFLDNSPGKFRYTFCQRFLDLLGIPNKPPLVVELYNTQVGRFVYHCLVHHKEEIEKLSRTFVLVGSPSENYSPNGVTNATSDYWLNSPPGDDSVVVVNSFGGGGDTAVSGFAMDPLVSTRSDLFQFLLQHKLLDHWYAVNGNIHHPKFTSLPMGFWMAHHSGRSLLPYSPIRRKHEEQYHQLLAGQLLEDLNLQRVFANASGLHPTPLRLGRRGVFLAQDKGTASGRINAGNGGPLYEYLKAHPELSHMTSGAAGTEEYYAALNRFAFVACPLGESYDSSCIWEALVFGAIPLVYHPEVLASSPEHHTVVSVLPSTFQFDGSDVVSPRALLDVYKELPVVAIKDPAEIDTSTLKVWQADVLSRMPWKRKRVAKDSSDSKVFRLEKLFMQHWMDKIHHV